MFGLGKDRRGSATVEFAIVSISIMVFVPLVYDLASVIKSSMALNGSLRAGVQYALSNPNDSAGIAQVIKTASGLPAVTITTTQSCSCAGTATTCGSTCTGGGSPAMYVAITANYSVPTMIPYANYPLNSFPVSSSTNIRVQ